VWREHAKTSLKVRALIRFLSVLPVSGRVCGFVGGRSVSTGGGVPQGDTVSLLDVAGIRRLRTFGREPIQDRDGGASYTDCRADFAW